MERKTYHPLLIDSITATSDLPAHRFIGFDGKLAVAGKRALGVTLYDFANGETANAGILGVYLVTAGGAITAGDLVEVGTNGKAIKANTGIAIGVCQDTCTADGETVRVILGASVSKGS